MDSQSLIEIAGLLEIEAGNLPTREMHPWNRAAAWLRGGAVEHIHVAGQPEIDRCGRCGRDIRDTIHTRKNRDDAEHFGEAGYSDAEADRDNTADGYDEEGA